jgi:hypothetical protein
VQQASGKDTGVVIFRYLGFRLLAPAKRRPPIIGATCAFDAKIDKIVDGFFDVSACGKRNNEFFQIFDFCFQLPSLLVDFWGLGRAFLGTKGAGQASSGNACRAGEDRHKYSCFGRFFVNTAVFKRV